LVLGHRGDDVVTLVLVELDDPLDGQVVRLGRATREDDVLRLGVDQPGDLLPPLLGRLLGFPAEPVAPARRVAERLGELRQHRFQDPRVYGRRRVVVSVEGLGRYAYSVRNGIIRTDYVE